MSRHIITCHAITSVIDAGGELGLEHKPLVDALDKLAHERDRLRAEVERKDGLLETITQHNKRLLVENDSLSAEVTELRGLAAPIRTAAQLDD